MKTFQSATRAKDTRQNCEQNSSASTTAQCKGFSAKTSFPIQRKPGKGNLPSELKTGIESLSGMNMDDVRVHYNSAKPSSLQALAYTQGSDIHIAPGQEKHLAHEAWHVVQQRQGRVQANKQLDGVPINDNAGLEREADAQGAKAKNYRSANAQGGHSVTSDSTAVQTKKASASEGTVQRQEHLATGLKKKDAVDRFASKSKARISGDKNPSGKAKQWAKLTNQQRADKLVKYANAELKKAKVPPLKAAVHSDTEAQPSFRYQTWDMQLVGDMSRTDQPYVEWLIDTVYHESRHAEQNFRMARIKAGEGKTATEIATDLSLPADIAKAAVKRPLKAQSKVSKALHSKKYNERQEKKMQEGDSWYQSIWGTGRVERTDVLNNINTGDNYNKYLALPEEVDAYTVGPMAKDRFKELMKW
jgi:hypothetical protein